jgi:predicted nucleic acid-binding protein
VIGLDTSVVLRLLTGEPAGQAAAARRRLESAVELDERVVVTDLVLVEVYVALHHHYGFPNAVARAALRAMAESGVVEVQPPAAVHCLSEQPGAGVADRFIHARHRSLGLLTLTLDRKQAALEGAERLR